MAKVTEHKLSTVIDTVLGEPGDLFSQVFVSLEAAEVPRLARGLAQQSGAVGARVIAARAATANLYRDAH